MLERGDREVQLAGERRDSLRVIAVGSDPHVPRPAPPSQKTSAPAASRRSVAVTTVSAAWGRSQPPARDRVSARGQG